MLGTWLTHDEYRKIVVKKLADFSTINPFALYEYESIISKLYFLDLDPLKRIIKPHYSTTGRPSKHQAELFRSFIIINHLQITLDEWLEKVKHNYLLRIIAGFADELPRIASYYDFINRLVKIDEKSRVKIKKTQA